MGRWLDGQSIIGATSFDLDNSLENGTAKRIKLEDGSVAVPSAFFESAPTSGIYKSGDGTGIAAAGSAVIEATSTSITNHMAPIDPFNVKYYGAVGDGVTDDETAFQAALDFISITGGSMTIPEGTYIISRLIISANTKPFTLLGEGFAKILVNSGGVSSFLTGTDVDTVLFENITFQSAVSKRILEFFDSVRVSVVGCIFNNTGNQASIFTEVVSGAADTLGQFRIDGCIVNSGNSFGGFYLKDAYDSYITNSTLTATGTSNGIGIRLVGGNVRCHVNNCTISGYSIGVRFGETLQTKDSTFTNLSIHKSGTLAVESLGMDACVLDAITINRENTGGIPIELTNTTATLISNIMSKNKNAISTPVVRFDNLCENNVVTNLIIDPLTEDCVEFGNNTCNYNTVYISNVADTPTKDPSVLIRGGDPGTGNTVLYKTSSTKPTYFQVSTPALPAIAQADDPTNGVFFQGGTAGFSIGGNAILTTSAASTQLAQPLILSDGKRAQWDFGGSNTGITFEGATGSFPLDATATYRTWFTSNFNGQDCVTATYYIKTNGAKTGTLTEDVYIADTEVPAPDYPTAAFIYPCMTGVHEGVSLPGSASFIMSLEEGADPCMFFLRSQPPSSTATYLQGDDISATECILSFTCTYYT